MCTFLHVLSLRAHLTSSLTLALIVAGSHLLLATPFACFMNDVSSGDCLSFLGIQSSSCCCYLFQLFGIVVGVSRSSSSTAAAIVDFFHSTEFIQIF